MGQIHKKGNVVVVMMKFDELMQKKCFIKLPDEPAEDGKSWFNTVSFILNHVAWEILKEVKPDLAIRYDISKIICKDSTVFFLYGNDLEEVENVSI